MVPRHTGRVREGGRAAGPRTPRLHRQPRLARRHGAACSSTKARCAFHTFYVRADDLRRRVVDQKIHKIAQLQIGLIAHRKPMCEASAHGPRTIEVGGHERTALAHEADGLGWQLIDLQNRRRTQHHAIGRTDHTEAVRPHHTHAVACADIEQLSFALQPLLTRIRKARGDNQRTTRAQSSRLLDLLQHLVRRHREDNQIGRLVQLLDRGIGLEPKELLACRIDGQHLACITVLEQHAEQSPTELGLVFRRAHQGNRCGIQKLRQRGRVASHIRVLPQC